VVATDPSGAQIGNAVAHGRVTYKVQAAEQPDLDDASVDLVTAAQALHWFDFERFYSQVNRVLKPNGVIAAWTYTLNLVTSEVDAVTRRFYDDVVGSYWPPERRYIEAEYRSIPFPFREIEVAPIFMTTEWTFDDYVGYLRTWSSTQRYAKDRGHDPVELVRAQLLAAWGGPDKRLAVVWPIHIRAGRKL
jgi:SAM-dependent methyltransferase